MKTGSRCVVERLARVACHLGLLATLSLLVDSATAEEAPLWEVGAGAGAIAFPDYRGSDQSNVYPLPVPYLIYRGRYLQADREGLRGILMKQPRAEVNISVNATTPVDSDHNEARAGMPDLDAAVEIGPSLNLMLWKDASGRATVEFRLPVRGAVTLSADPQWIGWQVLPQVNVDFRPAPRWNIGMLAGPIFTDARYSRYFYEVAPRYATRERPVFEAGSGYAGTQFLLSTSRRFDKLWVGAFTRYDDLRGAAFAASPLMKQRHSWMSGVGFAWVFAQSTTLVALPD